MPYPAYGHQPAQAAALTVTVTHPVTGVVLLGLVGELDLATGPTLDFHVADVLRDPGCTHLILNVSRLSFCAAAGLGNLLRAHEIADRRNIAVCLISNPVMDRLLTLTDLRNQFVTVSSLTAALDAATVTVGDTRWAPKCLVQPRSAASPDRGHPALNLSYQTEHNLFPSMPSSALRDAQPLVRDFCAPHELPYQGASLLCSYTQVVSYLRGVGAIAGHLE